MNRNSTVLALVALLAALCWGAPAAAADPATQIRELAPVLNRPSVMEGIEVQSSAEDAPIAWMLKRSAETIHLFAVNLGSVATEAAITIAAAPADVKVEVIGESRTVPLKDGRLDDSFKPYEVHLYTLDVLKP